ncbi:MAG: efflux transporter outer membrane subunit [Rubrivivax sp.]|nr:efflux transporter outer membrane subunit [Rubrivivax sp.]
MKHSPMAATLAVALLAGCAGLSDGPSAIPGPAAVRAEAAVVPGWQAPVPTAGDKASLADWWQRFDEPALPALVTAAQAASPTLAVAAARIERARAGRTAAGAALLPAVSAFGRASQGRELPRQPVAASGAVGVQAGWELDLFGGAAAGRDAAQARLDAAQAGWHDTRLVVAAETAVTLTTLRACEAQLQNRRADAASREQTARLTVQAADAGFSAPADAALARAGAAQARSLALAQAAACDTLVKGLVELTALPEPALRQTLAAATARVPRPAPVPLAALPASLLAERPDLVEAERAVIAAAGDRAVAAADEKPRISLAGSLAGLAVRSGGETRSGATWTLGPLVIDFPLFDGGRRAAASAAARAGYDEAVALYQARVRRAVREVESALVALAATAEREADALQAVRDFEATVRAAEARQRGGLGSLFDLENARLSALAAQSALTELQRERAVAWTDLVRALGGGWSEPQLALAGPR